MFKRTPAKAWYAIYTKSRAEKKVFQFLQWKEIDCYLPLQRTMKKWSDRKHLTDIPLLRSYVFVYVTDCDKERMRFIPGMARMVSFDGQAICISDKEIRWIQLLEGQKGEAVPVDQFFNQGDKVKVVAGPLVGLEGELIKMKGKHKVVITISSVNQSIMVEIAGHFLAKTEIAGEVA